MPDRNNYQSNYNKKKSSEQKKSSDGGKVYVENENDNCASSSNAIRCVLVGDPCVGKTSLIAAYTNNAFTDRYIPTAFDNFSVTVNVDEKPLKFELFDTAGRSEFDTIRTLSYADANIFLLCFSLVKPDSLSAITQHWIPELRAASPTTPILLVGTQSDLKFGRFSYGNEPDLQMISKIADTFQIEFIECSAITQHNLKEVFDLAILYGISKRKLPRTKTLFQSQSSLIQNNIIKEKKNNVKEYKNTTKKTTANPATTIRGLLSNVVHGNNDINFINNNNKNHNQKKNNQKNELKLNSRNNNDSVQQKLKYFATKEQSKWTINNNVKDNKKNVYEKPEKINQFHKNNISNKRINDTYAYQKPTSPVLYNRCAYDSGMHSERSMPSTTFKDGFRKLVSMTRRFL